MSSTTRRSELRRLAERVLDSRHPETAFTRTADRLAKLVVMEVSRDADEPVTAAFLTRIGASLHDPGRHGNGPRVAYVLPGGRLGVRETGGGWWAYLLAADGFDGTESPLAAVPTCGHVRRLTAAIPAATAGH